MRASLAAMLGLSLALASWAGAQFTPDPNELVCPRVAAAPVVDGLLGDACWQASPVIRGFTTPGASTTAAKSVAVRLGHDDSHFYLAATCAEPQPQRLKTQAKEGMRSVWQDDCLEVFIRLGDSLLDHDQFIVNAAGVRQAERMRSGVYLPNYAPLWQAAAHRADDRWTVEMALPFATLGVVPQAGDTWQFALGREDYTSGKAVLSNWPTLSTYGATGAYGRMFLGSASHLRDPALVDLKTGRQPVWGFGDKGSDSKQFDSVTEGGQPVMLFRTPDRYCVAQQSLKLRPGSWYRLEGWVKGTAAVNLRARTAPRQGETTIPYDVTTRPGDQYAKYEVRFPTGETGDALIILGSNPGLGQGEVRLANLRVVQDVNLEADGPAIPVAAEQPTVIRKLLVTDCRALRGFLTSPVDGRLKSYDWDASVWEYGMGHAGAGVGYGYRQNDGLHLTLADKQGVDAVIIRRGAAVELYAGADRYDEPGRAPRVWTFKGQSQSSRALFPKRVPGDRFSFFHRTDGLLADVSFLRVGEPLRGRPGGRFNLAAPGDFGELQPAAFERFAAKQRSSYLLTDAAAPPASWSLHRRLLRRPAPKPANLALEARQAVHFLTPPLPRETPLDAVAVELQLAGTPTGCPMTVAVQDPLEPRAELMGVDLVLQGATAEPVLDFPDQVVPAGTRLWLTVTCGAPVTVEQLEVQLVELPRAAAVPEALAYRKLQMRGLFSQLSEGRNWMTIGKNTDLEKYYREAHYGPAIRQLVNALDHCLALDPADALAKCYHQWIWRKRIDLPPYEPQLDQSPGAPPWAVLARQLWLLNRGVAEWWLENRLVPTGELGGLVGDDSDFYQNLADLPMMENGGVAGQAKAAAADLAELAEATTLEGGLNKHTMDPLHAYEEGVNHEALLLWWNYGDPVYFERCLLAARNLPALTTLTAQGHRHFKNQLCGAEDMRIDRPLELDGDAHPLMWHPALEVAWYNRSPGVLKYLDEWADGWLAHMKPGEYATMVDVQTEAVTQKTNRPLYGGYSGQATVHNFLYWITDDPKYLQPFADGFSKGEAVWPSNRYLPELWHRGFMDAFQGTPGWLSRNQLVQALAGGDRQPLYDQLKAGIAELQRFWPMYTTAEVFTDRVFLENLEWASTMYCGGFATRNKFNHSHAVSWAGFGTDYAAWVQRAHRDRLKVLIYNFQDRPQTGQMRVWSLDHGQYRLTLGPDVNGDEIADRVARQETLELGRADSLKLALAPRQVMVLELTQVAKLDDLRLRPDLALSAREVRHHNAIIAVAHNLGGGPAPATVAVLRDPGGVIRQTVNIRALAAPTNLEPQRVEFRFSLPRSSTREWTIALDPQEKIPELYEGNNTITLR